MATAVRAERAETKKCIYIYIYMPLTYKEKFNKKYDYERDTSHSINEIAKKTGYKKSGLDVIYSKGKGSYYTNKTPVPKKRKASAKQWGYARIYAAVDPTSNTHRIDKSHLKKK
jgi:hypothetical protein